MVKVHVVIDGLKATGDEGETILALSKRVGVDIPTLCYGEELRPSGVCRICVVEVEGSPRLVAACHTPIAKGMVIHTASPKVLLSRRITLELLMAGHRGPCVLDPHADACQLHQLASRLELEPPRFQLRESRSYGVEETNPYVVRDLSKCILCRRCVGACHEIARQSILSVGYRGVDTKIIVGFDRQLDARVCRDCGICVDVCPTSALRWSEGSQVPSRPGGDAVVDRQAKPFEKSSHFEGLLAELKTEQLQSHCVSEAAMTRLGNQFQTPLGQIYGLASFYSFLSTAPTGRNVIRVCKSLPCFLKNGPLLLEAIEKAIGIGPGQTTEDGRFSLELTHCIGACDKAPAILVNHDVHEGLTQEDIPGILAAYG